MNTRRTAADDEGETATVSLVNHVVDAIVDGVMRGRYVQGQRLVAADLAEEYAVSRAPVREALHMLAGEGVVELIANRGARIRRLSVEDRVEFLEFTEAILVLGVRLAAGRMREPGVGAEIEPAFAAIEKGFQGRNAPDFVQALYRYHVALNRVAGNGYLEFFYQRPYMRFYTSLLAELAPGGHWERYIENYRLIHATVLSGDAHSAVIHFVSHIRWVLGNMRRDAGS